MKTYLFNFIIAIVISTSLHAVAFGSPTVGSVAGSFIDGQVVSIFGQNFGMHPLKVEWLGGPNGNIEGGIVGSIFSKPNWYVDSTTDAFKASEYSSTRAHSGSKSIKSYTTISTQYGRGYLFDTGGDQDKVYASWWVYIDFETGSSDGQWKMWRVRPDSSYGDTDGEIMSSAWYNSDGSHAQSYIMYNCGDWSEPVICYPNSNYSLRWLDASDVPSKGVWQRMEVFVDASSSGAVRDGSVYLAIQKPATTERVAKNDVGTVITRLSGIDPWRYFVFQNYFGNISGGDRTKVKIYIDDIYIQTGTKARIEIGDASTWSSCKQREIQYPNAWSSSSITLTFNKGSFPNGRMVFFYVVDANGSVNAQGYPVVIGANGGSEPPPSVPPDPPSGLMILN